MRECVCALRGHNHDFARPQLKGIRIRICVLASQPHTMLCTAARRKHGAELIALRCPRWTKKGFTLSSRRHLPSPSGAQEREVDVVVCAAACVVRLEDVGKMLREGMASQVECAYVYMHADMRERMGVYCCSSLRRPCCLRGHFAPRCHALTYLHAYPTAKNPAQKEPRNRFRSQQGRGGWGGGPSWRDKPARARISSVR